MSTTNKRILLVEDEPHLAEGIIFNLGQKGLDVVWAKDGIQAEAAWKSEQLDLVILDLMLPFIDGFKLIKHFRSSNQKIPILIASAKSAVEDRIKCLEMGVDDYLPKPFHLRELILRVEALLKKLAWYQEDRSTARVILIGDYSVNTLTGLALTSMGEIRLTDQEIKLLDIFDRFRNTPLSRNKIMEEGWGYSAESSSRNIDNFIVRFRKYFEIDPKNPKHFKSIRSVGYVLE